MHFDFRSWARGFQERFAEEVLAAAASITIHHGCENQVQEIWDEHDFI